MLLIHLIACLTGEGKVDEGPTCIDTPTDVALDEVTPLGFAAQDVLALANGAHDLHFTYGDGSASDGSLDVTPGASARFIESVADYGDDTGMSTAIGIECSNRVEVDATEAFGTDDGAFAESWSYALSATSADLISFGGDITNHAFSGTYVVEDHLDVTDYDALSAYVNASFDASGTSGGLSAQASGEDDCGDADDCTAWATQEEIGSWGTVEE